MSQILDDDVALKMEGHTVEAFIFQDFPLLMCSCGFTTGVRASWAEAGERLDQHIRQQIGMGE